MISKYDNPYGKLVERISIPVDARMKAIERGVKAQGFQFSAWARDILADAMNKLADERGIKP